MGRLLLLRGGGIWRLLVLLPLASVTIIPRKSIEGDWYKATQTKFEDPTRTLPSKEMKEEVLEGSIKEAKLFNTSAKDDLMNKASILLPLPMDLWRRNISLDAVYSIPPRQLGGSACSCLNPMAKKECCVRTIHNTHKMGVAITTKLFRGYQPGLLQIRNSRIPVEYPRQVREDYRDVLMFRNIYAALKSGYLYHLMGRECWLDWMGKPIKNWNSTQRHTSCRLFKWPNLVALKLPTSLHRNRSLCEFLNEEDEKLGMRVYIDFVFNDYYKGMLALWALAHTFPEVRERTKHACYEDFLSPTKDKQAIESSLSFLFNQTTEWHGKLMGQTEYVGGHGTSHNADPDQSRRLLQIIRELDEEVFNNEIAWVDSVLPC